MLEAWFVQKYNLPPSHELYQGRSLSEHLQAYFEDLLERRKSIEYKLQNTSVDVTSRVRLLAEIKAIDDVLEADEKGKVADPLSAYWEGEIAEGREPNLDLTLEDLRKMGRI